MLARPGAAHELQEDRLHRGEGGYAAASPSIEREPPNLNAGECTNGHYGSSTFSGQSVLADGVATMPPLLILSGYVFHLTRDMQHREGLFIEVMLSAHISGRTLYLCQMHALLVL